MWKKNKSCFITDSGHIILSAVQPETVAGRLDKDISKCFSNNYKMKNKKNKLWRERKMIVKPTVTELLKKSKNRYELVIATSKKS